MAISYQTGDDFDTGGSFLDKEGWYHMIVTAASDTPCNRDGQPINNAMFRVDCTVAAGTAPNCRDKTKDLLFFYPNPNNKDGGEFGRKIVDRALLALNVIQPDQKNAGVDFTPEDLVGRQFIVHLQKDRDGKYLELAYADIFHVDDPEVAEHPKDGESLAIIPAEFRRIGNRKPAPRKEPAAVAAAAAPINVDTADI
jgi:hypothetical protein